MSNWKIKFINRAAGPLGNWGAGQTASLPEDVAASFVEAGAAVVVEKPNPVISEIETTETVETAAIEPVVEQAVVRRGRKPKHGY